MEALSDYSNINDIKQEQVNFLDDLMNGFNVIENILKPKGMKYHKATNLYLMLLGNPNKKIDDI